MKKTILMCAMFALLESCSMSQQLGNSGFKITAGADVKTKTAYACLVADVEKISTAARHRLETLFPQLKGNFDDIFKQNK